MCIRDRAEARPVVDYVIRVVAAELPPGDAKAKNAAAAQILPLIHDIAEPVERDHYLGVLSKTLGVDVAALRAAEARLKKGAKGRGQGPGKRAAEPRPASGEPYPPFDEPPPYWDDAPRDSEESRYAAPPGDSGESRYGAPPGSKIAGHHLRLSLIHISEPTRPY